MIITTSQAYDPNNYEGYPIKRTTIADGAYLKTNINQVFNNEIIANEVVSDDRLFSLGFREKEYTYFSTEKISHVE